VLGVAGVVRARARAQARAAESSLPLPRGCGRRGVVREFVTEVEACLEERLGAAKLERSRALLVELDEAL
jgi:hypothetical protein